MTTTQRGCMIVATMTMSVGLIIPPAALLSGVFLLPLIKSFTASRGTMALVLAVGALAGSTLGPAAGWLLDRIEARWVVASGALLATGGILWASQARTLLALVGGFGLFGAGVAAAGVVPAAAVVSNWFERRRGLALAITMTGIPLGGVILVSLTSFVITHADWRWAYVMLAGLTLLLIPIVLATVKSRPDSLISARTDRAVIDLPGLELAEGLRRREFWLMGYISLVHLLTGSAANTHAIAHFVSLGMTPMRAGLVMSSAFAVAAITKPLLGVAADRFGVRPVLALVMAMLGIGVLILLVPAVPLFAWLFALNYGVGVGAPAALIPMLGAEAFGLRRFATLFGGIHWFNVLAFFGGTFGTGYIFDVKGSYAPAFIILGVLAVFATLAPFACRTFSPARAVEPAAIRARAL